MAWPGGEMAGFILWMSGRMGEFAVEVASERPRGLTVHEWCSYVVATDPERFNAFLERCAEEEVLG